MKQVSENFQLSNLDTVDVTKCSRLLLNVFLLVYFPTQLEIVSEKLDRAKTDVLKLGPSDNN